MKNTSLLVLIILLFPLLLNADDEKKEDNKPVVLSSIKKPKVVVDVVHLIGLKMHQTRHEAVANGESSNIIYQHNNYEKVLAMAITATELKILELRGSNYSDNFLPFDKSGKDQEALMIYFEEETFDSLFNIVSRNAETRLFYLMNYYAEIKNNIRNKEEAEAVLSEIRCQIEVVDDISLKLVKKIAEFSNQIVNSESSLGKRSLELLEALRDREGKLYKDVPESERPIARYFLDGDIKFVSRSQIYYTTLNVTLLTFMSKYYKEVVPFEMLINAIGYAVTIFDVDYKSALPDKEWFKQMADQGKEKEVKSFFDSMVFGLIRSSYPDRLLYIISEYANAVTLDMRDFVKDVYRQTFDGISSEKDRVTITLNTLIIFMMSENPQEEIEKFKTEIVKTNPRGAEYFDSMLKDLDMDKRVALDKDIAKIIERSKREAEVGFRAKK